MRILHHVGFLGRNNVVATEELRRIGVDLIEQKHPIPRDLYSFEISEEDHRWKDVARLLREYAGGENRISDRAWTVFTQQERDEARFLSVGTCWTNGYPEPSDIAPVPGTRYLPYFAATYDLSNFCPVCFTGARQNAPFRMKKNPTWGRRSIMRLNWVDDELFVKPDVCAAVFEPFGVERRPVLLDKTGAEMDSVVQLVIPQEVVLDVSGLQYKTCPQCGSKKYSPICRGFFPPPLEMATPISKSREYFGFDTAFKEILLASALYEKIRDAGLKGAEFQPCRS